MKYMSLDLHAKDEGIAIIKINRPEVLNALNKEAMSELSTAIDIVGADDKVKVLIMTGTGERSSKQGGEEWYFNNYDPQNDPRTGGEGPPTTFVQRNNDGSWKVKSTEVRYEGLTYQFILEAIAKGHLQDGLIH